MAGQDHQRSDVPLNSQDLAICQKVLETLCADLRVDRESDEGRRIGVIAIQLVQQGVRDEDDLLVMVRAARGVNLDSATLSSG
jgi:hypothetical protein